MAKAGDLELVNGIDWKDNLEFDKKLRENDKLVKQGKSKAE